ncbi:MAG TPA: hypothetical protein VMH83_03415 [Candidatus Acidoferrum sp.]|nr:hypothetical protein [Candidatus Acidoferrum sp.]
MRNRFRFVVSATLLLLGSYAAAQPPGVTPDMINTTLPLDGAPLAKAGQYATIVSEEAYKSPRHFLYRPAELGAFPKRDTLPVMIWGNGGCAMENRKYSGFLSTIASHGILVLTSSSIPGEEKRQVNADDLRAAIDWAYAENVREDSPLRGKIDLAHIAVMGQSCGGFLSITLGGDSRVATIGVFNSGVQPAPANGAADPSRPTTEALTRLHGPVLFINGHKKDFMMATSRANFDLINDLPAFYGSRHNAGHTATMYHPGGGEFANVATNWLLYQFKGDKQAAKMFVGKHCELCSDRNWDTASKGLK